MSPMDWLMEWYAEECNGDWEHSYGVRMETLDNPGWKLKVDLVDTDWEGREQPRVLTDRSDTDWMDCRADGHVFEAHGGPGNLGEMVEAFRQFVEASS